MGLEPGFYRLRANPGPGVGGMYATGEGIGAPLLVAPETPPYVDRQLWEFRPYGDGTWHIFQSIMHAPPLPGQPGFGYSDIAPEAPVILDREPKAFQVEHIEGDSWSITATGGPIGVRWVVAPPQEGSDRVICLHPFPIELPVQAPSWQLLRDH
ncbi:hypothetical protein BDV93DRAFT_579292 [Ceratobasidium sp. AG-I]|nr:hypothetical protein BDV93DRAFT_579292 [Ceratobasidium sp. AG-I]